MARIRARLGQSESRLNEMNPGSDCESDLTRSTVADLSKSFSGIQQADCRYIF